MKKKCENGAKQHLGQDEPLHQDQGKLWPPYCHHGHDRAERHEEGGAEHHQIGFPTRSLAFAVLKFTKVA